MPSIVCALLGGVAVEPALAQSGDELKAVMRIETPGQQAMDIDYYLGPGRIRMDTTQDMSLIWMSGDHPSMLMIQHPEKRYMEWGPDQLKMMQQMMQRIPGAAGTGDRDTTVDPEELTFEETGRREQIGEWDAFEVRMTGPDHREGSLWLTTDVDTGLFELSVRVAEAASALSMPMAGGGAAGAQEFLRYRALVAARGLPDGRVIRIVSMEGGQSTLITLMSLEPGPLPGQTFDTPTGYNQMQMPSIPGFPGR